MNRDAKYLRMNLLAPAHDINRKRENPLRRGRLLLLRSVAPLSHPHRVLRGLLVVPILPLRVPQPRARARGGTPHTFKSIRT